VAVTHFLKKVAGSSPALLKLLEKCQRGGIGLRGGFRCHALGLLVRVRSLVFYTFIKIMARIPQVQKDKTRRKLFSVTEKV
jgi:hypothetical protein